MIKLELALPSFGYLVYVGDNQGTVMKKMTMMTLVSRVESTAHFKNFLST